MTSNRRRTSLAVAAAAVIALLLPISITAAATNGGFETGDTSGWIVKPAPIGGSVQVLRCPRFVFEPNPPVPISDGCGLGCPRAGLFACRGPAEGNYFARLKPGEVNVYTVLSQGMPADFSSGERATISGYARFNNNDPGTCPTYNDRASIVLVERGSPFPEGIPVDVPFERDSCTSGIPYKGSSGWVFWTTNVIHIFTEATPSRLG